MDSPTDPDPAPLACTTPRQAREMRRRLLERVADSEATHLTIDVHQGHWQPLHTGVEIKVLREHEGVLSYLLRLAPGASLPAHRHPLDEEGVVLQGRLQVGSRLEIGPGGYHLAHRGALHATIRSRGGALLFLRGAVPVAQDALG